MLKKVAGYKKEFSIILCTTILANVLNYFLFNHHLIVHRDHQSVINSGNEKGKATLRLLDTVNDTFFEIGYYGHGIGIFSRDHMFEFWTRQVSIASTWDVPILEVRAQGDKYQGLALNGFGHISSQGTEIIFGFGDTRDVNKKMILTNNGKLGIGTMSPKEALHIKGNLIVEGSIINSKLNKHLVKGRTRLKFGKATIPYKGKNEPFVMITPIRSHLNIYVEKIEDGKIHLREDRNNDGEFFYLVSNLNS